MTKLEQLFDFNHQLESLIEPILDTECREPDWIELFGAFMLGKSYKTHQAILLLCKNGYGEDAFILTRTLFESLVNYLYIVQDTKGDRLQRYVDFDWKIRKQMYDYLEGKPQLTEIKNDPKRNETLEMVLAKSLEMQNKYNFKGHWWSDKKLDEMANDVGRGDQYKTVYRLQCNISHTNACSMNDYMNEDESKPILNIGPSKNWVKTSLVVAFDTFGSIIEGVGNQFDWGISGEMDKIMTNYKAALAQDLTEEPIDI